MAYVRKRGRQIVIAQGERDSETGKVQQRILFTIYSKAEALQILGRGNSNSELFFRDLLERQYPDIRFNWKKISEAISANMDVLPDLYEYKPERLRARFRADLCAFTRQLILADPQENMSASQLIKEHTHELEYLADLIQWRLKLREQEADEWNQDNPFYWRFSLQGTCVPPDIEEEADGFYEKGEFDRATAVFRLLVDSFDNYAEGYNYLGLIALDQDNHAEAIVHFEKTIEVGRKLFPKRIARRRYWRDFSTRPYMRGLRNLTLTLICSERYEEALALCERLEEECGDDLEAAAYRSAIFLNTGRWQEAANSASRLHQLWPSKSFIAAFALFELGQRHDGAAFFLHGALNHPRAARMLVGLRSASPRTNDQSHDHNTGVYLWKMLPGYLHGRRRKSLQFFKTMIKEEPGATLVANVEDAARRWQEQRSSKDRTALEQMSHMRTFKFARKQADNKIVKNLDA